MSYLKQQVSAITSWLQRHTKMTLLCHQPLHYDYPSAFTFIILTDAIFPQFNCRELIWQHRWSAAWLCLYDLAAQMECCMVVLYDLAAQMECCMVVLYDLAAQMECCMVVFVCSYQYVILAYQNQRISCLNLIDFDIVQKYVFLP